MNDASQDPNRLQQSNVLPFSPGWRPYLGNLGSHFLRCRLALLLSARLQKAVFSTGRLHRPSYRQERNDGIREGCNVRQDNDVQGQGWAVG